MISFLLKTNYSEGRAFVAEGFFYDITTFKPYNFNQMRKKYLTKNHLRSASSFVIIGDKYFLLFPTVSDMTNTKLKNRNLNVRGLPLKMPVQKIIIVAQVVSSQSVINVFGYFPTVSEMTNTKLMKYQL